MNLGSSAMELNLGSPTSVKARRTKKKRFLLPEDQMDRYLSYEVWPIPRRAPGW